MVNIKLIEALYLKAFSMSNQNINDNDFSWKDGPSFTLFVRVRVRILDYANDHRWLSISVDADVNVSLLH